MGYELTGDQFRKFSKRLGELGRQVGQEEYPYDPERALAALQAVIEGEFGDVVLEHELRYSPGIIGRLADEGNYRGYRNPEISDGNYPVTGEGVAKVRFRLIAGEEMKRSDGWVYRSDVETYFRDRGMRFPNAAEALLPPAENKQLGRGEQPYVAFISVSGGAFIVVEHDRARHLDRYVDIGLWFSDCVFLGVCE